MKKFLSLFAALLMVGSMWADVTFPAGTVITFDGSAYAGSGYNIYVPGTPNVTPSYAPDWFNSNLTSSPIEFTLAEDWTVTTSTGLFKSQGSSWSMVAATTLPEDADHTFLVVGTDGASYSWQASAPAPVVHTYELAGSFNSWGAEHVAFVGNTLTYNFAAGSYDVKIVVDGSAWKGYEMVNTSCTSSLVSSTTDSNANIHFYLPQEGDVTFTIGEDNKVCIEGNFGTITTHTYALAGSFNEWGTPVAFEGNSLTYNLAAGQYDVKIVVDGTYKGYSEIFNAECSSEGASQSDAQWNNIRFTLAEAADITVTIGEDGLACFEAPFYVRTIVRETLTFHAGAMAEADPVFFVMTSLGAIPAEGNPDTDETIEMVAGENGVYTAEIDNESQSFYIVRCAPGAESIQWYQDAENQGNVWNGTGWVAKSATEFWFAGHNAENGWIMDLTTEAPVQTYTLTVTEAGWATMFLPFATEAVEGTTIYTGVLNAENTALVLTAHEQVPVHTPVLVQAEAGEYVFTEIADFIGLAETSLYGVTEATAYSAIAEETGKTVLTLGVDENEAVGFHAPSNAAGSLPANKCCLLYEGAADASIRLVFNEATGLEMNAEQVAAIKKIVNGTVFVIRNGQMFDLNGRIVK